AAWRAIQPALLRKVSIAARWCLVRLNFQMYDCTIVGGGIVGLATAMTLVQRQPGLKLLLVEKESDFAQHQSGRNSGVIHSGIYYKPGSFKAKFAREGSRTMVEFCREHGIKYDVCGKV